MPDYSETSARIQAIRSLGIPKPKVAPPPKKKVAKNLNYLESLPKIKKVPRSIASTYVPPVRLEPTTDSPHEIARKLNTLEGVLDPKVFSFDKEGLFKEFLARIQKEKLIDISHIGNMATFMFNRTQYRTEELMHGGGTSSSVTFYSDAVSGTINGSNVTFTVPNTITTALALYLANSVYQPTTDFTTSGTTITMVVAPDASLSGQPFWLLHT